MADDRIRLAVVQLAIDFGFFNVYIIPICLGLLCRLGFLDVGC